MTRPSIVATLVALPAVAAIGALTLTGAAGLVMSGRPQGAASTFTDAIVNRRGVEEVYAFIREGTDPAAPILISDGDLPGLGGGAVAPLVAAVAAGDSNVVHMLLDYSEPGDAARREARALAVALGDAASVAALDRRRP